MKVWLVEFNPRGTLVYDCFDEIWGVYDSFEKAKKKVLKEIKYDIERNDFVAIEEDYENLVNHNNENVSVSIEMFRDEEENYNEYYILSIHPHEVE